jgi:hypothetical protein
MTVEERMEKLERWNRWLLAMVIGASGIAVLAGMLAAVSIALAVPRGVLAQVRARSFVLVDENGKPRAELDANNWGVWLSLDNENGETRISLSVDKDASLLGLYGAIGKGRASVCVDKDGPALGLFDENDKPIFAAGG